MKRALQFGAGNIGRGFLGQLYYESGYATTFVDVLDNVVQALNERGGYPLRIVDEEPQTLDIRNVSALHAADTDAVAQAIAEADIAATAVGVNVLPKVAPTIAQGIEKRYAEASAPPLNFIVCENLIDAGPFLREKVREHLAPAFHGVLDEEVGFVEASIGRMVPIMTEKERAEDPLLICVEAYCDLPVDKDAFKGPIPELKNLQPKADFGAYVERKLFVHNLSHATAAYLGYLRGHEYIWQTMEDEKTLASMKAATNESCEGLARKWDMDRGELDAHAKDLAKRYRNKALGDQVRRIAADPVRKLGPNDRLIGAGRMCIEQGIAPEHIAFAAAAAMRYDHPADGAAERLQIMRKYGGIEAVLREICDLDPASELARLIVEGDRRLRQEGWVEQDK
ncbi:MAG: mannitol-1-phosphate 5-dehydrogenase [Candidatus Hydrogenedentota bacterium]